MEGVANDEHSVAVIAQNSMTLLKGRPQVTEVADKNAPSPRLFKVRDPRYDRTQQRSQTPTTRGRDKVFAWFLEAAGGMTPEALPSQSQKLARARKASSINNVYKSIEHD